MKDKYFVVDFLYYTNTMSGVALYSNNIILKAENDIDAIKQLKKDYKITQVNWSKPITKKRYLERLKQTKDKERWKNALKD